MIFGPKQSFGDARLDFVVSVGSDGFVCARTRLVNRVYDLRVNEYRSLRPSEIEQVRKTRVIEVIGEESTD